MARSDEHPAAGLRQVAHGRVGGGAVDAANDVEQRLTPNLDTPHRGSQSAGAGTGGGLRLASIRLIATGVRQVSVREPKTPESTKFANAQIPCAPRGLRRFCGHRNPCSTLTWKRSVVRFHHHPPSSGHRPSIALLSLGRLGFARPRPSSAGWRISEELHVLIDRCLPRHSPPVSPLGVSLHHVHERVALLSYCRC